MEAVLGLNSYLQDQFGALADIYMPIEGISESKPNQEFVFRKTPNTIKAKALTLDKIKGKTLAWNQLVPNGDFSSALYNWQVSGGSNALVDGMLEFTANGSEGNAKGPYLNGMKAVVGHKYFIAFDAKATTQMSVTLANAMSSGTSLWLPSDTITTNKSRQRVLWTNSDLTSFSLGFRWMSNNISQKLYLDNIILVDLTLLYGTAIDGMTDVQILAKFESEFPGYHAYNPGVLISNDASALETIVFNQWEEEWEIGYLDQQTGEPTSGGGKRAKNFIRVFPSTTY
jgi:hypothetical protein